MKGLAPPGYENALVIGRVVLNTSEFGQLGQEKGARWIAHEFRHAAQSEPLGVYYLPAYGLLFLLYPYEEHPMERDARKYSNENWQRHQGDVR